MPRPGPLGANAAVLNHSAAAAARPRCGSRSVLRGNQVRAVVVGAVIVLVGAGDDVDRRAAVEDDDGRDRPMIRGLPQEGVRPLVVVEIPYAGKGGRAAPVIVRRTSFFPLIGKILRRRQPDRRLI